jgi:exoribonuclease-2
MDEKLPDFRAKVNDVLAGIESEKSLRSSSFELFHRAIKKAYTVNWLDFPANAYVEFTNFLVAPSASHRPTNAPKQKDVTFWVKRLQLDSHVIEFDDDLPSLQAGLDLTSPSPQSSGTDDPRAAVSKRCLQRTDLPDPAVAIDSQSTVEVDDAISIGDDGWLHVHVADPATSIASGSTMDEAARQRALSIYLPHRQFPMLRPHLSKASSLDPDRSTNDTITFSAKLAGNGDILDYRVTPSRIHRLHRLTYESVDEHIAKPTESVHFGADLAAAFSAVSRHRAWRKSNGMLDISVPKGNPKLLVERDETGRMISHRISFTLEPSVPSLAHILVSESMVIAGRVAAMYAQERKLPIPYRYHRAPESEQLRQLAHDMNEATPLFDRLALLEGLSASAIDLAPSRHWSMGLDAYSKATSPLRRYSDLLLHQQLHSTFSATPVSSGTASATRTDDERVPRLSVNDLALLLPDVYRHEQYLKRLMASSRRYWTLAYMNQQLQQRDSSPLDVTVLPLSTERPTSLAVFIEQYGLRHYCPATFPGCSRLRVGEPVRLLITHVDPIAGDIQFTSI